MVVREVRYFYVAVMRDSVLVPGTYLAPLHFFHNSWDSQCSLTSRSGVSLQSCRLPEFQSSGIYFPEIDL